MKHGRVCGRSAHCVSNRSPFRAGGELLDDTGKEQVDKIAALLINNYPGYRVAVRGHTGAGDEEENRKLSLARAQVVVQYLIAVHAIDARSTLRRGQGGVSAPTAQAWGV